jgi:hypothetical protein
LHKTLVEVLWDLLRMSVFIALKTTDPVFSWTNIYGISMIHACQTSMNIYHTGAFHSKKFSYHSLLSMHVHSFHHFTLLLCWTGMTGSMILMEVGKAKTLLKPH